MRRHRAASARVLRDVKAIFSLAAAVLFRSAASGQQLVKMNSRHRGLPIVKCIVAGRAMSCLLDSGSDITFVPPSNQLKTSSRKFAVKTAIGTTELPETEVTIQIGSATVTVVALVQEVGRVMPFDAILGENVLRAFRLVSFDYDRDAVLFVAKH